MAKVSAHKYEKELIRLAVKNDQSAFFRLFERYSDQVYTFILGIIPHPQDAEDICQETFNKAFKNISTYREDWAFSTWLYKIAQNTAFDFYRKRIANMSTSVTTSAIGYSENTEPLEPTRSPEDNMITQQTFEQLIKSIKGLDVKYRKVAELRFINDYAYEEIAKELDLPVNTVKTHINRARKLLAEKWKS
ncbi:MAG: sigma-70 family RNA polymerase sigma factor [Rikenellaceae bacterium]|nr:sigma-70 family RNA polymerase sigma factor [Rikenellaceae bacterium]